MTGVGSVLNLRQAVVRATGTLEEAEVLSGAAVDRGGTLHLTESLVEDSLDIGVGAVGLPQTPPPQVHLVDTVVRRTATTDRWGGHGVLAASGATVEASRLVLDANEGLGLVVGDESSGAARTTVRAADLLVLATESPDGLDGFGLVALGRADVRVSRAWILRNRYGGVAAWGHPPDRTPHLVLEDVEVRGTRGVDLTPLDWVSGWGVLAKNGVDLEASRLVASGGRFAGVYLASQPDRPLTTARLRDVVASGNRPTRGLGRADGIGLFLDGAVDVTLTRARLEDNTTVGLYVRRGLEGGDPSLSAQDLDVRGTRGAPCGLLPPGEPGTCVFGGQDESGGIGVAVSGGAAAASLSRFAIRGNETVGLLVAGAGVDARHGVGISLLVPDLDVERLSDDVWVYDNTVDVGRSEVRPPSAEVLLRPL